MVMESALSVVAQSRSILVTARDTLTDRGLGKEEAEDVLDAAMDEAIDNYLHRREIIGSEGTISLMGGYIPAEYYFSAIFTLFAALGMLPLIHFSAADLNGSILRRGLLSGEGTLRFFLVRVVSGFSFIALILLMLFPASLLLRIAGDILGAVYGDNPAALALSVTSSALCLSALAAAAASWAHDEKTALWAGFIAVLVMAAVSGIFVPEGALPAWASGVGQWLPLRPVMRTLAGALFEFDRRVFVTDLLKLCGFTAVFLTVGYAGFRRRGRGA
jgi:hypothetical protein